MPELANQSADQSANQSGSRTAGRPWVTALLVIALVAIFAFSFVSGSLRSQAEESFAGTDSVVTDMLSERGVTPWFEPLFQPNSGEVESGLFALQAGLGGAVLGFALGNLRGRRAARAEALDGPSPTD
ncbi:energy-coupling factor ABC transporter substrate-binding protein [Nigerium massiliense]|uniref:energy-coupling factor ABC transporter substrate-binding protein n=1 Tax=Nigerium massiliense TaxID=1522317 RepID=UPI0009E5BCD7|nr:energy-coupling factor ABC transporter substrate-binding protein [Nigerium massiliense]